MNNQRLRLRKNIIILGAGFGGIACVLRLEKLLKGQRALFDDYHLILADRKNYHLYTPNLYEAATTSSEDGSPLSLKKVMGIPIAEIINGKMIKFVQSAVSGIDIKNREILFNDIPSFKYEYIVFALGAIPMYFGIPGIKEHSIPFKWFEDGIHIRSLIRKKHQEKKNGEALRIIVGGGGTTGVEISGELVGYIKTLNKKQNKTVRLELTLLEREQHILPGFDERLTARASVRLHHLGILIKTNSMISKVNENFLYIQSASPLTTSQKLAFPYEEVLKYDVFIWAGGVQANTVAQGVYLEKDPKGRLITDSFLRCLSSSLPLDFVQKIYAVGDNACFYNSKSHLPVPGTAPIAIEQGKIAAENIYGDIIGRSKIRYVFKNYPFVIPIGGKYAITKIGPCILMGFSGWFFKQFIEIFYLLSITSGWKALLRWWRGIEIFSKND